MRAAVQSQQQSPPCPMTPNVGPYDPEVISDACAALFHKIGPAIFVTHSQGGGLGWLTAIKSGSNWSGVTCNQGRVISITAICGATLLNAPFPQILSQLTAPQQLQIRQCGLTGPIPDIFANLPRLSSGLSRCGARD